ncbi:MAG: alpha/beta fold hydrolase [Acidimicrobiales bacterium]
MSRQPGRPRRGDGERLHLGDHGAGPPVLLVHGQPGLGTDWDLVTDLLADDHRVLVPDRPGYGRSALGPFSLADNAELLAELLRARHATPAVVVGHSYGGGVAVLLATRHPELVKGLVLVGSVGVEGSINGFDHLLAVPVVGEVLSAAGMLTVARVLPRLRPLARVLPHYAGARLRAGIPDDRYVAGVTRQGRRLWRTFVAEQRSLLEEVGDVERALPDVAVPTVVVSGTWDIVVPPSVASGIAAAVPGAELVTVAQAGHFVPRDHPSVVADAVRRVEGRAGG